MGLIKKGEEKDHLAKVTISKLVRFDTCKKSTPKRAVGNYTNTQLSALKQEKANLGQMTMWHSLQLLLSLIMGMKKTERLGQFLLRRIFKLLLCKSD
jgi:hypothetical protein